ncbi:DMT family transporter [Schinkia azotoformans]|uniref:DMT family transporter n=1 Tax=Schinkia azotoformans TaxID=1454 RepID=UPI002DBFA9F2|nr:EamA family transporter [Schinkia azotoformans]MEC1718686.1 EamA family transporter [Schinkia azotoformans]MEC1743813.1 EamA family transporter [Schinkia azotoformans]MEC1747993.1 EamA family transporter [Schinkia azotoformans]MEC1760563.1 EamA family transporter [Schinkia azotoformans]MEC1769275.1 EamA family transporter [Schinkia azotoformans]
MKAAMVMLCLIWGFNFVIMKLGNGVFPPGEFATLRFLTGSFVLIGVCLVKKIPLPSKSDFKWLILCGLFQTAYFNIAIQVSLNYISAGLTSVLTYSMPLFLSIMAHRWIPGERLTSRKTFGILIGIVGLFTAMNIHEGGAIWAVLLALSSAISWAIANLLFKLKLKHCDTIQFTTWQMTIGAIGLLIYTLSFEHGEAHWGLMPVVYILFSGVIASSLAFVMWNHILRHTQASTASISLLLVPIVGVISGYIFLNENLSIVTLVGILLVLVGIWIVNRNSSLKTEKNLPRDIE